MQSEIPARAALCLVLLLALALAVAPPSLGASKSSGKATPEAPVDLNSATVETLTTIPGIGKVMAERIVAWREEHGPFRRVEDLIKVKGVGDKTFEKLRPYVKVDPAR